MNKKLRLTIISAVVVASTSVLAAPASESVDTLPILKQESQHEAAAKRISRMFTRSHYSDVVLNDELSKKIFDKFVRTLDSNKNILLKQDVDAFTSLQTRFDEAIKLGDLTIAYEVYSKALERRVERFEYALSLLDKPFDFTKAGDKFHYQREDAEWPVTTAELDELWRQRVKYDALNLKMADKDPEEARELLQKRYQRAIKRIKQTTSEDVFQTVMNSFARSIEAHTSYLSPRNAERFQMEMNLSFEGIGAVLRVEDDHTVIQSIVPGGPADASNKLKPEDKIVGVAQDDKAFVDVIGWRLDEVVDLIKGPKGSAVRLQVMKGSGDSKSFDVVELVRDKIKLEDRAAKSEVIIPTSGPNEGEKVGVIEIPSFYNALHEDVKKEIESLQAQDVKGMIIDLRGNGGGSLPEAILLSGLFIEKGPVVQVRYSEGRVKVDKDTDGKVFYDGPLTVLVDRYSASASEIFAAAMQDYNRALIIGEQTFGKGTVQQHRALGRVYDLYDNPLGSVQFTIAKFYRINGGSTQHKGVVPDISYPSAVDPADWGESQEENALPWDSITRANYMTFNDSQQTLDILAAKHKKRVMQDPEFQYLFEDIADYQKNKDETFISLVEKERLDKKQKNEQKRLARANERLVRMGMEAVASLDDLPEDIEFDDPFLLEAANITIDMVDTGKYAIRTN